MNAPSRVRPQRNANPSFRVQLTLRVPASETERDRIVACGIARVTVTPGRQVVTLHTGTPTTWEVYLTGLRTRSSRDVAGLAVLGYRGVPLGTPRDWILPLAAGTQSLQALVFDPVSGRELVLHSRVLPDRVEPKMKARTPLHT